jgi:RimJ/RimL family protein N-acetyltransferase
MRVCAPERKPMTKLIEIEDLDFVWMLGGDRSRPDLKLPPGGVDTPATLGVVRCIASSLRAAHDRGAWMMVYDGEVVGLCSYLRAPDAEGEVEIGYGVAETRRNLGHATRAVAAMLAACAQDAKVRSVVAMTPVGHIASERPLERNGFVRDGTGYNAEDGELTRWRRP